jgi:betaine-homocysteine S-methyltransferase
MQAFTFYASDNKLNNRGNQAGQKYTGVGINHAAAKLAKQVANEGNALTLGGISQCPSYLSGTGKEVVQAEFRKQIEMFLEADLDFLLCEVKFL